MTGTRYLRFNFPYERGTNLYRNSHEWHPYEITPYGWEESEFDTNRITQWSPFTYYSLRDMKTYSDQEFIQYFILTRFREHCDQYQISIPIPRKFMR